MRRAPGLVLTLPRLRRPDGGQLRRLARLLGDGQLAISVAITYGLRDAAEALARIVSRRAGGAVALKL